MVAMLVRGLHVNLISVMYWPLLCIGEAFIPYYTGKAIDGIVVHQSMEYFTKPLITLSILALARQVSTILFASYI